MLKKILPYTYIIIIVCVILIRVFIISPVIVNGASMEPNIKNKEIMFLVKVKKYFVDYKRFDIVVVHSDDEYLIKRVIALPNETIKILDNTIYINGKEIKDEYGSGITSDFDEYTLKEDEYFVMGDNREVSKDSRFFGPFNKKDLKGYANIVIYPFNKIRIVD